MKRTFLPTNGARPFSLPPSPPFPPFLVLRGRAQFQRRPLAVWTSEKKRKEKGRKEGSQLHDQSELNSYSCDPGPAVYFITPLDRRPSKSFIISKENREVKVAALASSNAAHGTAAAAGFAEAVGRGLNINTAVLSLSLSVVFCV